MKYLLLLLAFSMSGYAMAGQEHNLSTECTPWFNAGHKLANGEAIKEFRIYTVGYPVEGAFIQFKDGEKIPADINEFGPFTNYDTGTIIVSLRRNGANDMGEIKYFGKDGNYYVDGVETYRVVCSSRTR